MTNVYRILAAHGPAHLPAPHGPLFAGAAKILAIVMLAAAVVCAAIYVALAVRSQAGLTEQTIADARLALVPGMSRADCYAWLRAHRLVATNTAFTVWRKTALGVWYRADDGAWPQPPPPGAAALRRTPAALMNPDAVVNMSAGSGGACGMTTTERISFDRFDRIARVTASDAYWNCR